jgi:RNA polymerase sigma-70 factor (ECF subfamily)
VSRVAAFDDVLAAARDGAAWAFRALWEELSPPVLGYLRSRGATDPEDLTSEVFLAAFTKLAGFTGDEAGFRAYVFTIAHRRLIDDIRRRSRRGPEQTWTAEADPRRAPSAEDAALDQVGSERTRELLETLAPDQRDVLVLRIFGDLTVEQVAEVLGKRPGAVKALQRRGLEALRKKVSADPYPSAVRRRSGEVR